MNTEVLNRGSNAGRDHWSHCFPCLFSSAGTTGGTVNGRSDPHAAWPVTDPVSPAELAATISTSLGISPELRIPSDVGQPAPLVDGGQPLNALFT